MKKILSFVTVFLLIVALSVPALAVVDALPNISGVWVFNDNIVTQKIKQDVNFSSNGENFTSLNFNNDGSDGVDWVLTYKPYGASYYTTRVAERSTSTQYWTWNNSYKTIDFGTTSQEVSVEFYDWLSANATHANATPDICDGSTCPATDLNADGICDDCGAPLSLRLTGYPALPVVNGNNLESVVLQRDDGYFYMALTSDTPYSVSGSVGDNYLITVADETDVSYVTYKCTDGQNWVHNSSGSAYSLSVGSPSATLLASTFDWYKDGSLFFSGSPVDGDGTGDTGGDAGTDSGNVWDDEHSSTLWGWLDGVVSGLKTVWEAVINLPQLIWNNFKSAFDGITNWLSDIWDSIKSLPDLILDGIKGIFIPDTGYIDTAFATFLDEMKMKFSVDTEFFETLFDSESAVQDTYVDYNISGVGAFNLKVFDTSFFVQGITYFRPFVRGFLVLMLFLFHVKQLIGFFGYDAGVVAGRTEHIKSARESQKGE